MDKKIIGLGLSDFKKIIDTNTFYVDKTGFIKEWCDNTDEVTLITRPRRFGKTLTMSMLEYFFSDSCKEDAYLFKDLRIWQCGESYRKLQGSVPVINISFINVRHDTMEKTYDAFKTLISDIYTKYDYLLEANIMNETQKNTYIKVINMTEDEVEFTYSLKRLSEYLERYTGKKSTSLLMNMMHLYRKLMLLATGIR